MVLDLKFHFAVFFATIVNNLPVDIPIAYMHIQSI